MIQQMAMADTLLLKNKELSAALGSNARDKVLESYDLAKCLPKQLGLISLVASGALGS